jgi:hypothetical protein
LVLTDAGGVGAEPGLGRVDGAQIDAGVGAGFVETGLVETGLVMAGERGALVRVRCRRVGQWLRRRMLERP